jgi:hypothetical protein
LIQSLTPNPHRPTVFLIRLRTVPEHGANHL